MAAQESIPAPVGEAKRYTVTLECDGIRNWAGDRSELIPWQLVQQIDVGFGELPDRSKLTFYVTAEFFYAEFQVTTETWLKPVLAMSQNLTGFDQSVCEKIINSVLASKRGATLYVSPLYPDAGIFPKYRTAQQGAPTDAPAPAAPCRG